MTPDAWRALTSGCVECGAPVGEQHWPGCGAGADRLGGLRRIAAAAAECRRRGWAVAEVPGEGLRPCDPSEPGSYVDLDRYAYWLEHGDEVIEGNES